MFVNCLSKKIFTENDSGCLHHCEEENFSAYVEPVCCTMLLGIYVGAQIGSTATKINIAHVTVAPLSPVFSFEKNRD